SPNRQKALTIHSVGNLRKADFGGETGKISPTSAIFQKQLFENLKMNADNFNLKDYEITLEATHHGPLISKPSVFIEIGPTEEEWKNRKAGFIVAKTINDTILGFEENPYNEIAIALGGPHYCPNFNKIQLKSNVAISHVIAQYNFPFTEEMLLESLNKTDEKIDFAILDWKGLGTTEQRSEIVRILEKNYVQWKKTGDVDK
ncbi:MAG TPA: D-aminoacyl-tRNA deacylase, partial [Candidatus Nanoarchaeia archaeon]|nr:D-aminoacyl-tRNA deacylase [Candidatus Nanoarchaeia archaeon]